MGNLRGRKIIFVQEGSVTPTIVRLYSIQALMDYGYNVEIWSLRFLKELYNTFPDEIAWDNYEKISTFEDFVSKIESVDKRSTLILTSVAYNFLSRKIYSFIHTNKIVYLYLNTYVSIVETSGSTLKERIDLAFSSNIFRKIMPELQKIYVNKIYTPLHHVDLKKHIVSCNYPRVVAINSNDYESYLELEKEQERNSYEKFILFIDISYPIHPDIPYAYGVPLGDQTRYLPVMNRFFDKIEQKYNMPVVIALHPKSTYTDADFCGRRTIKYKTSQLIKDCEMVLTHCSTSTTLAVIYNKPTMFLYTQYMKEYTPKMICKLNWYAKSLGKEAIKIDDIDVQSLEISGYPENKRNECIYTYMTTKEHEKMSNAEILISLCDDIFEKLENGVQTPFDA